MEPPPSTTAFAATGARPRAPGDSPSRIEVARPPRHPTALEWFALVTLTALVSLTFLDKAVHLDDALYLRVVDAIRQDPLRPYAGKVVWDAPDGEPAPLLTTDFNPPLWKYALASAVTVFGEHPARLHLLSAAALLALAAGLFRLGSRWCDRPLLAVALTLTAPWFLPGVNLMLEPPMLALAVWGMDRFLTALERERATSAFAAGLLLGLAILTKYTAGLLLPFWFAVMLTNGRGRLRSLWPALVLPVLMLLAWIAWSRWAHGASHFGAHDSARSSLADWPEKFRVIARTTGGVFPLGLLALVRLGQDRSSGPGRWAWIAVIVAVAGGLAAVDVDAVANNAEGWPAVRSQLIHVGTFQFLGTAGLFGTATLLGRRWWRERTGGTPLGPAAGMLAWFGLVLAFNLVATPFVAVRHLCPLLLPLIWPLLQSPPNGDRSSSGSTSLGGLALLSAGLGIVLALSDREMANDQRDVVVKLLSRHAEPGRNVWHNGTWGFGFTADRAGAHPVVADPSAMGWPTPKPGDLLLTSALGELARAQSASRRRLVVRELDAPPMEVRIPIRTIAMNTNYYAVSRYALPWQLMLRFGSDPAAPLAFEWLPSDHVAIREIISVVAEDGP